MTDFNERYQNYSNLELLRIIENPNSYQPQAVETAKAMLAGRQLPQQELDALMADIAREKQTRLTEEQKKKEFEAKLKAAGESVFSAISPIQAKGSNVDSLIKSLTMFFGLISVYQLYTHIELMFYMVTDSDAKWDFGMGLFLMPVLLYPIATFLFYKRKNIGWFLIAMLLTFSLVGCVWFFAYYAIISTGMFSSIYSLSSIVISVFMVLLYSASLWVICKEEVREVYGVSTKYMVKALVYLSLISCLLMYLTTALRR